MSYSDKIRLRMGPGERNKKKSDFSFSVIIKMREFANKSVEE